MIHTCSMPASHAGWPAFFIFPSDRGTAQPAAAGGGGGYLWGHLKARCELRNLTGFVFTQLPSCELAAHFCSADPKIACITGLKAMMTALGLQLQPNTSRLRILKGYGMSK